MELLTKTGEALSGLWLAFDSRERLIVCYLGVFVGVTVLAALADRGRRRRESELDELAARVAARLVHA